MTRTYVKRLGLVVVLAAMVGVAACGEGGTGGPDPTTPPPTLPPDQSDAGTIPPDAGRIPPDAGTIPPDAGTIPPDAGTEDAGTQPSAARGQAVFAEHCNVCHPGGQAGVGPSLIDSSETPDQMRIQIRNGGGGMPPFPPSVIPDPELEDLIAYLLQLQVQ